MARRRRGLHQQSATPFSAEMAARARGPLRGYKIGLYSMIPGLGVILGPVALLSGLWYKFKHRKEKEFPGENFAVASMLLGAMVTVTNWLGLFFILSGLKVL